MHGSFATGTHQVARAPHLQPCTVLQISTYPTLIRPMQIYGAPSGTKIVHAPQRDYLDRVTETRVWQTCIQIALRELAFWKRVSKSRYENSRLELAPGKRVFKSRYGTSRARVWKTRLQIALRELAFASSQYIVLRGTRDWELLDAPYRHETRLQNRVQNPFFLGKCVH